MPRNRKAIPKDQRAADLLRAATEVFVRKGFAETTMNDISAEAAMARANVYWYFPSKDELFAAVMSQLYANEIARLDADTTMTPYERLKVGLLELYPYRNLHMEMHARILRSAAIRECHDYFIGWMRGLVYQVIEDNGAKLDKEKIADIVVATLEGARAPAQTLPASVLIPYLLDRLLQDANKVPD